MFYMLDWEFLYCLVGVEMLNIFCFWFDCLDEMRCDVEILVKVFDFVCIDVFCDGKNYMFGELIYVYGNVVEYFFLFEVELFMFCCMFEKDFL